MSRSNSISSKQLVKLYRRAVQQGLSLEKLEKKISKKIAQLETSSKIEQTEEKERVKTMRRKLPKKVRYGALILPIIFLGVGLFLLGNALTPIAGYYFSTLPGLTKNNLQAPIPAEEVLDVTALAIAQVENKEPVILDTQLDYTNLSNWFDDERSRVLGLNQDETTYVIDIPKVKIKNAVVKIGGMDLSKSLIAYPGTALPGKKGAPVIFGHSTLRQFYNPSETNNSRYTSIFSYIMTLDVGDEIYVTHDGIKYKYLVRDKTEVKPEDTYILAQQYDSSKLKLVTCVPEGTYLRRGVITAELVKNYDQ